MTGNIRIEYEKGLTGLIYATSPDLPGLLVAGSSMEELETAVPAAIKEMQAAARIAHHIAVSEAAQRYHDLAETEARPRPEWIDAWQALKAAIKALRDAEARK